MAAKLSVPSLTRAWQMLLKGLFEVRDATRPIAAAEMALIRLSYAADLPPTDKLVRDVMDGAGAPPARSTPTSSPSSGGGNARAQAVRVGESSASVQRAPEPTANAQSAPLIRSLEDLAALAQANNAPVLKVNIENDIHLVRLEPGQIEFRPSARAPRTLSADLAQKLKDWTGTRWMVTVAREGGAPTIAEARRMARDATFDRVRQEPLVRAVLDRFPGAEIVAVRDLVEEEIASPTEEDAS
jgi:DNA polymerase-3 subunit gamma/tau